MLLLPSGRSGAVNVKVLPVIACQPTLLKLYSKVTGVAVEVEDNTKVAVSLFVGETVPVSMLTEGNVGV